MNVLDLFSGIGGFSLGLERAGMRTVAFCEPDEFCRAVLRKHWPDVPIYRDVRRLSGSQVINECGPIDVICGGFPCQPFSVAGKQKGKEDDRHLWPHMRQVIEWLRPSWVIGENVTGLIPMALDEVLLDLESLGYTTRTFVIPACAVDAYHRRDRVWIIACNSNEHSKPTGAVYAKEMAELCGTDADTEALQRRSIQRDEQNGTLQSDGITSDADSDELRNKSGRGSRKDWTDSLLSGEHGAQRSLANSISERFKNDSGSSATSGSNGSRAANGSDWRDGEHAQWSPEPDVGRVAHGVPRRVDRLRSLGNAVVPQVVEEIGRAIMRASQ